MRVLVTNDDGINSPGIHALADALREIAEVTIVAPDRDRSGASHSVTLSRPVYVTHLSENLISVQGTPTDCVYLAMTSLLDKTPDIVVSGVNAGANLGDDVIYSGTVGAALVGRFLGLPSIAVSLVGDNRHFATAAIVLRRLINHLQAYRLQQVRTLNINVPDVLIEDIEGYEVTRLGSRHHAEPALKQKDPRGRTIYWIGDFGDEKDAGVGTDFYAVKHNKVSITPLNIDLTCYRSFDEVANWLGTFSSQHKTSNVTQV